MFRVPTHLFGTPDKGVDLLSLYILVVNTEQIITSNLYFTWICMINLEPMPSQFSFKSDDAITNLRSVSFYLPILRICFIERSFST
jgi:hypothetical protein